MPHVLCVENLTKTFAGCREPVIRDVSFCIEPGQVLALVGPSGCGKTTTLRCIMGFERPEVGCVRHNGRVLQDSAQGIFLPPERRGIGFVFQDYALFPHLSVLQNVMFGIRGVPRRRRKQIASEALWMVGLMGYEERRPHDLSGGQQQRVALARAIAPGSRVILLDEPFSGLDPELRQATRKEVRLLAERGGIGIILVTHDQEEALSTADKLVVMRDGRIVQQGPPEEVYTCPRCSFVAQFLGRTNLLPAEATGCCAETTLGCVELDRQASGEVTVSLRPEHLSLEPADGRAPGGSPGAIAVGTVIGREFKGHDITYRIRQGHHEYLVQTDYSVNFEVGQPVTLHPRHRAAVVEAGSAGA